MTGDNTSWDAVAARLADLPDTFRRQGATFSWVENAFTAGLSRYTSASDAQTTMLDFDQATGRWLDAWGRLVGIPRYPTESDDNYRSRVKATLLAPRGSPVAINRGIARANLGVSTVAESLPAIGYDVSIQNAPSAATRALAVAAMLPVRPAGMPFKFLIPRGGLFLSTINHFSRSRVTGSYFVNPSSEIAPVLSVSTNNSGPLLPTVFLSDPTLNPSV